MIVAPTDPGRVPAESDLRKQRRGAAAVPACSPGRFVPAIYNRTLVEPGALGLAERA